MYVKPFISTQCHFLAPGAPITGVRAFIVSSGGHFLPQPFFNQSMCGLPGSYQVSVGVNTSSRPGKKSTQAVSIKMLSPGLETGRGTYCAFVDAPGMPWFSASHLLASASWEPPGPGHALKVSHSDLLDLQSANVC